MKDVKIEMSKKRRTQMKIKAIRLHHWEICGQKKRTGQLFFSGVYSLLASCAASDVFRIADTDVTISCYHYSSYLSRLND